MRPRDLPPDRPVIQIVGLFAAGSGQRSRGPRLAPPELAGTVQRGNQNEPLERSGLRKARDLTLLPMSER
jgi:hypothetical protein